MLLALIKLTFGFTIHSSIYGNLLEDNELMMNEITTHQIGKSQNLEFMNCAFKRCVSLGKVFDLNAGGAISLFDCTLNVTKCNFSENLANFASCICCYGGNMTIFNSIFRDSKSFTDVGAVWSMASSFATENSMLNISYTKFCNNRAGRYHGALSSNLTNPNIYKCEFEGNRAEKAVGACAIITLHDANIEETLFINNTSGDQFNEMSCPCLFFQSNFENEEQTIILNNFILLSLNLNIFYKHFHLRII